MGAEENGVAFWWRQEYLSAAVLSAQASSEAGTGGPDAHQPEWNGENLPLFILSGSLGLPYIQAPLHRL